MTGQALIRCDSITYNLRESNSGDRSVVGSTEMRGDHALSKGEQWRRPVVGSAEMRGDRIPPKGEKQE